MDRPSTGQWGHPRRRLRLNNLEGIDSRRPTVRCYLSAFGVSPGSTIVVIKATDGDTARIQLVKLNVRWFREYLVHDPAPSLQRITVPLFSVTGEKDIQVDPADVERITELVEAPCTTQIVSDMTHLLRLEPGEPPVRTYKKRTTSSR